MLRSMVIVTESCDITAMALDLTSQSHSCGTCRKVDKKPGGHIRAWGQMRPRAGGHRNRGTHEDTCGQAVYMRAGRHTRGSPSDV